MTNKHTYFKRKQKLSSIVNNGISVSNAYDVTNAGN